MQVFSQAPRSSNKLWVLLYLFSVANLRVCYAESEGLDNQYDERFSLRLSSCPYSMTCAKRGTQGDTKQGENSQSGRGAGGSVGGDRERLLTRPGSGRSGPGVGRSGPAVGRSGPGVGRSGPAVGRSGPAVGRSGPGVERSGPTINGSEPEVDRSEFNRFSSTIGQSEDELSGLHQARRTNVPILFNILNETTNIRVRRELTPPSTDTSSADHERLPCYCDVDCSLYGDCCKDGPFPIPSSPNMGGNSSIGDRNRGGEGDLKIVKKKTIGSVTKDTLSCALLNPDEPQYEYKGVYMVSQCPSKARQSLARKCHKNVSKAKYNYMMDVPVVSETTGLVYANIYCAYCHEDLLHVKYNHTIDCSCDLESKNELKTMTYDQGKRTWIAPLSKDRTCTAGAEVTACVLFVHYPDNVGRHCEYNLIDKCADDWEIEADRELCQSYNYYIQDSSSKVYKNPICAKCNHVSLNYMSCLLPNVNIRFVFTDRGNVFKLSDLFDTNSECSEEDAVDIIFEECLQIYEQADNSTTAFDIIYIVLMSLSLTAMVIHMAIFLLLFRQRNLHTKNLFSMTCSLFGAELLVLICSRECKGTVGCYVSTVLVYYLFMSAYLWMNVMSYDVCKTFRSTQIRSNSHRLYIKYSVYAFGLPALMAAIAVMVDLLAPDSIVSPGFGDFWFSNRGGLLLFFIGPALVIFLANVAMLAVSMYDIYTHQKSTKFGSAAIRKSRSGKEGESFIKQTPVPSKNEPITEASKLNQIQVKIKENLDRIKIDKARLVLYSKLALIMGVPWVFAVFDDLSVVCQYIFNILNSLQGVFIFVTFDCKSKIMAAVCEKFGWHSAAEYLGSTSSNTATSSGGGKGSTKRSLSNKTSSTVGKLSSTS